MINNFKVSEHFSFFETTRSNNTYLLEENRKAGLLILPKICLTINTYAETIREHVLKGKPLSIHSLMRCWLLNGQTKGSSNKSQHPKGEAMDWSRAGQETRAECWTDFEKTVELFKKKKIMFGTIIFEEVERDYGKAHWIHTALGAPFRDLARCGQVLHMKNGKFTLLERVDVASWWE